MAITEICKARPAGSDPMHYIVCRHCNHSNFLHGGVHNPDVIGCQMCTMLLLIQEIRNGDADVQLRPE